MTGEVTEELEQKRAIAPMSMDCALIFSTVTSVSFFFPSPSQFANPMLFSFIMYVSDKLCVCFFIFVNASLVPKQNLIFLSFDNE